MHKILSIDEFVFNIIVNLKYFQNKTFIDFSDDDSDINKNKTICIKLKLNHCLCIMT